MGISFLASAIPQKRFPQKISCVATKTSKDHTEDTDVCLILLKIFYLRFTIGYFSRDSAKNKFLDLFSALAALKIRACKAIPIKSLLQSNVLLRILVKDFYLKILVHRQ